MDFIVHTDPDTGKKRLYPNKTNTPNDILKQGVEEFSVPTDKQGLMELMQELLDRIPPESPQKPENASEEVPATDTADMIVLPKEGPLSAKQELDLRSIVHDRWGELPFAWKTDLMCGLMDQVRNLRPSTTEA